jgi:hypothetical protein
MSFGVAAKYESPRANAEKSGDADLSKCKMQTALIEQGSIAFHKDRNANRNGFDD